MTDVSDTTIHPEQRIVYSLQDRSEAIADAAAKLKPLRPLQQHGIDGIRQAVMSGYRRPVLQAGCGFGKTIVAVHIVVGALRKRKRVAFCVHAITLIDQTIERFVECGIAPTDIGVIQGDHGWCNPEAPLQVCSAQTLARRGWPDVDVVIIDECHIAFAVYRKWMADDAWQQKPFIGLSATPWTRGLGKQFDHLIKPTSTRELIDEGWLVPFKVFAPSHPDLSGVKTVAGDYHEGQIAERMSDKTLVADVVETWLRLGGNEPTLCFAVNRAHARLIHDQFESVGVPVAYVDANTPREERSAIGKRLEDGEVKVVVNIGCLTTGIDWVVRVLILARPTKSEMLTVQIIGRVLRTEYEEGFDLETRDGRLAAIAASGKPVATIIDHSDTTLRLGFVTDIDDAHDDLDHGREKTAAKRASEEREIPLPRECPQCACLVPAASNQCPSCGSVMRRAVDIETEDGELVELDARRRAKPAKARPTREQLLDKPRSMLWGEIKGLAGENGKSESWCFAHYKAIVGCWPNDAVQSAADVPPSNELRGWVRHRAIAWAKAHSRERTKHDRTTWR